MLNSGDPVNIRVSAFSACGRKPVRDAIGKTTDLKADGSILELLNCISLRYSFYEGLRNVKSLVSGECRKIRIFRVNDCEVFL